MDEAIPYDAAVANLRAALVDSKSWARGFGVRARGKPNLVSARTWLELAEIEALCVEHLEAVLTHDLRTKPWTLAGRIGAAVKGTSAALAAEEALLRGVLDRLLATPIDTWRAGMPQLEGTLWPFFIGRTHYLANTVALALNEPSPWPAVLWNRHRQSFS